MRIVFAGTPDFAAVILEALHNQVPCALDLEIIAAYTQPDRPAGRGRKPKPSPVKRLADSLSIPIHQPETFRDATVQATLAATRPDVLVVAAYGLLLPPEILAIPRHGAINVHASLLPRWRGAAPIQRAIMAGDKETGISIMQMDEGLDTGAVLRTVACPIDAGDTAGTLHDRLALLGAKSLIDTLADIAAGKARPTPQDSALATYARRIAKPEGELDWKLDAEELERKVRAFVPWPVSYTTFQGQVIRVWESVAIRTNDHSAPPGTVIACGPTGIDIAARAGVLRLLTVQRPGAKPVAVADFLNGYRASVSAAG